MSEPRARIENLLAGSAFKLSQARLLCEQLGWDGNAEDIFEIEIEIKRQLEDVLSRGRNVKLKTRPRPPGGQPRLPSAS